MGLGRNKNYQMICAYKGHEEDCPKDCSKCAITIKKNGDAALKESDLDLAIRFYKGAVFLEPKYAGAWCNLANAYRKKSEYNNALYAFNKAIAIDPVYGRALYGKALTLKSLGQLDEALELTNSILELYDDDNVEGFREKLIKAGSKKQVLTYSIQEAITAMTDKAFSLLETNNLLDDNGEIHCIDVIDDKEAFASSIFSFCKKNYHSLGNEHVWSKSILSSYSGSLHLVMKYYREPSGLKSVTPFDYLCDYVNLEEIDRATEMLLGGNKNDNQLDGIWNIIYQYISFTKTILMGVESSDVDDAVIDATESAYVMGMLVAMKYQEQEDNKTTRAALKSAFKKLAETAIDYEKEQSTRQYCISRVHYNPEEIQIDYLCDCCGKPSIIYAIYFVGGEQIIEQYREYASQYTSLGCRSEFKCYCDECAAKYYPKNEKYSYNNYIFSVLLPGSDEPHISFPTPASCVEPQYKTTLAFLRGADSIKKLSEVTNTTYKADEYLNQIRGVLGDLLG